MTKMDFFIGFNTINSMYYEFELVEVYGIIIDNAIESGSDEIEIFLKTEGHMYVFEVRNKCEFISTKEIRQFFTMGYSTKQGKSRGTGLYKVKKMIESKKGTITCYYDTSCEKITVNIRHA